MSHGVFLPRFKKKIVSKDPFDTGLWSGVSLKQKTNPRKQIKNPGNVGERSFQDNGEARFYIKSVLQKDRKQSAQIELKAGRLQKGDLWGKTNKQNMKVIDDPVCLSEQIGSLKEN